MLRQNTGAKDLGPLLAYYPLSRAHHLRNLVTIVLAALGAMIALAIALWQGRLAMRSYGPMLVWRWMEIPLWVSAALAFAALWALIVHAFQRRWRVELRQDGLAIHRSWGVVHVSWDEASGLYVRSIRYGAFGLNWGQRMELRLETQTGTQVRIDHALEDVHDLMEKIKQALYPRLMRTYRSQLRRDESIKLGPLTLTAQGIQKGNRVLLFADIQDVKIENGRVKIVASEQQQGKHISAPAHHIPNIDLCVQILQTQGQSL